MRILFAGNPAIAVPTLESLIASRHDIIAVLVNPDVASGRSKKLVASPVKELAKSHRISVIDPEKLTSDVELKVASLSCDILVCFAYGKIFKESFLSLFPLGGVNIHPSLLPKHRGPTPIQSALLHGDVHSGITVQRLAKAMDSGDILVQREFDITQWMHASAVEEYVASQSGDLLLQALDLLEENPQVGVAQNHEEATYCQLMGSNIGRIDLKVESVIGIYHKIRAYSYDPGAYVLWGDKRLFISRVTYDTGVFGEKIGTVLQYDKKNGLSVQALDGRLWLKEVQLQGKKRMDIASFFNGNRAIIGEILS
ncbi:methionyl-tRNA formyltransferase [Entomospira entomophila]|uniref:Methionyl-tRNA formyltransferase n=1 Tax=Entomospira entomophila TaxID=2719988 RepID=A0A968GBM5_9SPIO|nr:methionyl-tRNA formyltransferase [Entomospira entomophilus]NIZ39954.1 methionyl-tRNA formyltransferase [Entomospira entomophilus]WDI35515.1 methionyl-tRNA formyltransferase [Entomospira entomophilus]